MWALVVHASEPVPARQGPVAHAPSKSSPRRLPAAEKPAAAHTGPLAPLMRLVDHVKALWAGMSKAGALGLAAQTAFWLFFSLLPLAAVGGLVAARIATARGNVAGSALASMPPAIREEIQQQLGQVAKWNGGTVAPIAAVVFVWLASSGIHAIFDALEAEAGVTRPWWKKRLVALGACVGLSVGLAVVGLLAAGVDSLGHVAGVKLPGWASFVAGRIVAGLLVAFAVLAGLYAIGTPKVDGRKRVILPGALLAMALQIASGLGYSLYLHFMGTGNAYEAGLGIVGVTLMFLYLFSLALLAGAELNKYVSDCQAAHEAARAPAAPAPGSVA